MKQNKKINFVFIIFSLLALVIFFVIVVFIKGVGWQTGQATKEDGSIAEQSKDIVNNPLIVKASEFYKSFVRQGDPSWGNGELIIIVFGDFSDQKSRLVWQELEQFRADDKMSQQVTLVWKSFPLATNPLARPMARAALCANRQGKFWQYGDLLFARQSNLRPEDLLDLADQLELNLTKFENCFNLQKEIDLIGQDMKDGGKLLIEGIPYVFVGSRRVEVKDGDNLLEIILQEIK